VAYWRYVVDRFRRADVTNVAWVWCVNGDRSGGKDWPDYYPVQCSVLWPPGQHTDGWIGDTAIGVHAGAAPRAGVPRGEADREVQYATRPPSIRTAFNMGSIPA